MPDPYMFDHLAESLRAENARLEARLRECRAVNTQLQLNLVRLAEEVLALRAKVRSLESSPSAESTTTRVETR